MKNIGTYFVGLTLSFAFAGCAMEDMENDPLLEDPGSSGYSISSVTEADDEAMVPGEDESEWEALEGQRGDEQGPITQCVPIPPGSYQLTCNNISVTCSGSSVTAYCRRRNQTWRWSTLYNPFNCGGGVWNNDGALQCG